MVEGFTFRVRENGEYWLVCQQCSTWTVRIVSGAALTGVISLLVRHEHAN